MRSHPVVLLIVLTGLNFLCYIDRILPAPLQLPLQREFALSNFASGALQTAFLTGYVVASPIFGARAHRGGRKALLIGGVLVWSLATLACGFATSLGMMLAARLFVGLGEAGYAVLAPTLIDDVSPPERKGRNLAVFYLAVPMGSACGFLLGGIIEERWGWRTAFFASGAPGLLLVLALAFLWIGDSGLAPPLSANRTQAPSVLGVIGSVRALWAVPIYRRCVIGDCAHTGAIGAIAYWTPKFIVEHHRLSLTTANIWFGLTTVVAGFVAILLGGRLADRAVAQLPPVPDGAPPDSPENRAVIEAQLRICGIGVWSAVPLALATFWVPHPVAFFALIFVAQLGLFVAISPVSAAMLRSVSSDLRASAMAISLFAIHVFGDLWTPPAVGMLADVLPLQTALTVVPALLVFGAAVWWPLRSWRAY